MTELTPLARKLRTAYHHLATTDPRIEAAARAIYTADQQDGDEQCWDTDTDAIRDTYVRLAKAAAEALGVTL